MALAYSARFKRWMAVRPGRGSLPRPIERGLEVPCPTSSSWALPAGHAGRRHHPDAQLADRFFPRLGAFRNVRQVGVFERQLTRRTLVVVTAGAVGLDQRGVGRGPSRFTRRGGRTSRPLCQARGAGQTRRR